MTVLEHFITSMRNAAIYNRHDISAPKVILWTDDEKLWEPVIELLAQSLPELSMLRDGEEAGNFWGPSTWVRYTISRYEGEEVPIVYLPGISRVAFRGSAGFPEHARHLYSLQFQGQFWTQLNGKDWTPSAFLSSKDGGLGLDLSRDQSTIKALRSQLKAVFQTPVVSLRNKKLEASDFLDLAVSDPARLILEWMGNPEKCKENWNDNQADAVEEICKKEYGFDLNVDGVIIAAEKLATAEGPWAAVWDRFSETPKSFVGVEKALDRIQPTELFDMSNLRIPANNRSQEDSLRKSLNQLSELPFEKSSKAIQRLSNEHKDRAGSIWATLGKAPLAGATLLLSEMVESMKHALDSSNWASLANDYLQHGWKVDSYARKAFAIARNKADRAAIESALRSSYFPWLEKLADQVADISETYPKATIADSPIYPSTPGVAYVFVDGLRTDIALDLNERLEKLGNETQIQILWSALPTVTATAKPAWQPIADSISGESINEGFEPNHRAKGKKLSTDDFRKLLQASGITYLAGSGTGDPTGCVWTETGEFDKKGHAEGAKLAYRIEEELRNVAERVAELLDTGWEEVQIITDHGWLWLPGGLPKTDLPRHLTTSKWGRCAIAQDGAMHGFKQTKWFWANEHSVVLAPGISVFKAGLEYAHGGLTIQETLTPKITVRRTKQAYTPQAKIKSAKWTGMRLKLEIETLHDPKELHAQVRRKVADSSRAPTEAKHLDNDGRVSLVVPDDSKEGEAAFIVVLSGEEVIAKQSTTIGEN